MTVHTQTQPGVAPSGQPARLRGVLAVASPAPDGWESGGIQTSRVCAPPLVRDKCISFTDTPNRPTVATFPAFMIEQSSACSTLSGDARIREATEALTNSTDWALGRTLYDGVANGDAPSLSDAENLGAFTGAPAALAAVECAAAQSGQEYTLHASVGAATYLAANNLIDEQGRSPSGALWLISAGYPCEQPYQVWATGRVWAAAGTIGTREAIDRRTNNREAWAERSAIVGFNTCINYVASFTPVIGGQTGGVALTVPDTAAVVGTPTEYNTHITNTTGNTYEQVTETFTFCRADGEPLGVGDLVYETADGSQPGNFREIALTALPNGCLLGSETYKLWANTDSDGLVRITGNVPGVINASSTVSAAGQVLGHAEYTYTFTGVPAPTGVTEGAPGAFIPADAVPADLAALAALGALGQSSTAWALGSHVILGDNSHAYWDGTAWAAGEAPAPAPEAVALDAPTPTRKRRKKSPEDENKEKR